jgi:hypothetical protein
MNDRKERSPLIKRLETQKDPIFIGVWGLSTAILGWQVSQGQHSFDSQATLPTLLTLLVCTAALLWWLAGVVPDVPTSTAPTRRGRFVLLVVLAAGVLFSLRTLVGPPLLFGLPVIGLVALGLIRPQLSRLGVVYALLLAVAAGMAGLGAGWVSFPPLTWAGLQVALVWSGLLAGWGLLRHTGLLQAGLGHSLFVAEGVIPALRGFGRGILIAIPWALGMVVIGAATWEPWVQSWWQPLMAIQPGIAEEAWGRVLLVPLLFVIFSRVARTRTALNVAVVVVAYWFAYLHTSGGVEAIFSTLMTGTLFALPVSYLWLRRGLETAIGFHFWLDFCKFVAAYALNRGLWLK